MKISSLVLSRYSDKRYNQYSLHLEEKLGCKVYKVTIDAGFNCPNRDGTISYGGCIFCDEGGSFSGLYNNSLEVKKQLEAGIKYAKKRFKAEKFIAYFQAFTNTYGPVEKLKEIYDSVFFHEDVIGLSIGTRPDCVDPKKIDLISSYAKDHYVWIEYGLQSIHDKTLRLINRGHTYQDFVQAVELTRNREINICAHVVIGLPEKQGRHLQTAQSLADLGMIGLKYIYMYFKRTQIEKMYNNGKFNLFSRNEYIDIVCDFLELLPPDVTIHRLAGNGLSKMMVAPIWLTEKFKVLNYITQELERRNSFQGSKYSSPF